MPEIPFSPPRELSQMLVFSATEDLNEPLKPRRPLTLLSHHDGDLGHPPAEAIDRTADELKQKAKDARVKRTYAGAAGLGRNFSSGAEDSPHEIPVMTPKPPEQPRRWKTRLSAKQRLAAEEAKVHFAKGAAIVEAMPTYGAASSQLVPKPGFFNILYAHPMNGNMPMTGEVGTKATDPLKRLLPPVNSLAASTIPPHVRRAAKVNWGYRSPFPPQDVPLSELSQSPSKHCQPSRPLPKPKGVQVHASTNPWLRAPPHTAHKKQIYERMFGPSPEQKAKDEAARRMQSMERGQQRARLARK